MTRFVAAYMPKIPLILPPLTLEMWTTALRRFRPNAARGADGWARKDLMNMSPFHMTQLLQLLTAIEQNQDAWPAQLLEGLVIAIAKRDDAHRPNEFRPIVLLSLIYRCWASLRSRQMLSQLEPYIHSDAHGFLPTREPGQTWLQIQAAVEVAVQSSHSLAGIGTDFVKAFNCISREPLWFLAATIGLPADLLHPWKSFVQSFTRRFLVCNQVGEAHLSTRGYAEGCPLSVLAMALVDWGFQIYQMHYAPEVRHFSFVDNISMLATQAHLVAWAFFTLRAFLTFWGLTLDLDKTYAWGTTPCIRQQLAQLGVKMVTDFGELGGALSFTAAHRVRVFVQRSDSLHERWLQLRRSRAPLSQKLRVLPIAFWTRALHGTLSCTTPESHVHNLRKQAIKHLGLQLAGSNSMLRLALATPMTADPGFFQVKTALLDFRRLCMKSPDLLNLWRIFMQRFDGTLRDGPFAKLLTLLHMIGWKVCHPPILCDHDGIEFDLFQIANGALSLLLEDAWLQYVATKVNHKTMDGLRGLDSFLTKLDHDTLTATNLARVRALQSGAFVSSWQHAKYDRTKQPICQCCMLPDTQKHWLRCPRFAAHRVDCPELLSWVDDLPDCATLHLLAPRSPFALPLKHYFEKLADTSRDFNSEPRRGVINHVFTDGSHFQGVVKCLDRSAWSVVNSTTGCNISHGHVPGILQTIGRAELWALISAVEWSIAFQVSVVIWTDSASTCRKATAALRGHLQATVGENHDLWMRLDHLLTQTNQEQVEFRWTPSHIDTALCENPQEEFLASWNDAADAQAVQTNRQRGLAFEQLRHQAETFYKDWTHKLRTLRDFYLHVAQTKEEQPEVIDLTADSVFWSERVADVSLGDALTVDWKQQLVFHQDNLALPVQFVSHLISLCIAEEPMQNNFIAVSFIELVLWNVQNLNVQFPVERARDGQWTFRTVQDMLLRPTVAFVVQKFRQAITQGLKVLGLEIYLCNRLDRRSAGIIVPVDGILLSISDQRLTDFCQISNSFFPRQMRKSRRRGKTFRLNLPAAAAALFAVLSGQDSHCPAQLAGLVAGHQCPDLFAGLVALTCLLALLQATTVLTCLLALCLGGGRPYFKLLPKVFRWWVALFQAFGLALLQASQLLCWAGISVLSSTSSAFVMPCFSRCPAGLGDEGLCFKPLALGGDSSTAQQRLDGKATRIAATRSAFAAILVDGFVVTWSCLEEGGDASEVQSQFENIAEIEGNGYASFAGRLVDGSVVS
eukprot:s1104_g21.t3